MNDTKNAINIDGKSYPLESLNKVAKDQLLNLQVVDQEIAQLENKLKIAKAARAAYANVLKNNLPQGDEAATH